MPASGFLIDRMTSKNDITQTQFSQSPEADKLPEWCVILCFISCGGLCLLVASSCSSVPCHTSIRNAWTGADEVQATMAKPTHSYPPEPLLRVKNSPLRIRELDSSRPSGDQKQAHSKSCKAKSPRCSEASPGDPPPRNLQESPAAPIF